MNALASHLTGTPAGEAVVALLRNYKELNFDSATNAGTAAQITVLNNGSITTSGVATGAAT